MTKMMVELIHQAIQGHRWALRNLLDQYKGYSYAQAFRQTKSFPQAQRIAASSWELVANQIRDLAEPERFPDFLTLAIEKTCASAGPLKSAESQAPDEHSVLRTGKVQARKALRQALADCTLPETPVFFMRFVEGLSSEKIAELYGVERSVILESLRLVCVEIAYRAGFTGLPSQPTPPPHSLSPVQLQTQGLAVLVAEGGLGEPEQLQMERLVQTDPASRQADEAVKQVLALAEGTFSAHHLPPDFSRSVLERLPIAAVQEPATRGLGQDAPPKAAPSGNPILPLSLASAVAALILTWWATDIFIGPFWTSRTGGSTPYSIGQLTVWMIALGGGAIALLFSKPPLHGHSLPVPLWYYIVFGLSLGCYAALACLLLSPLLSPALLSPGAWDFASDLLTPLWILVALILCGMRIRLAFLDLQHRFEVRLRRLETAPGHTPPAGDPEARQTDRG